MSVLGPPLYNDDGIGLINVMTKNVIQICLCTQQFDFSSENGTAQSMIRTFLSHFCGATNTLSWTSGDVSFGF